jgi:HPt (histidine-containing phosphotransfer) domain-containing protein
VSELDDVQTTVGVIDGLRARIAELEAEVVRVRVEWDKQQDVYEALLKSSREDREQSEAALAARERMLRLAWTETVQAEAYYWKYHDNVDEWLADLRARAEEAAP